jgi:hypothetical protein
LTRQKAAITFIIADAFLPPGISFVPRRAGGYNSGKFDVEAPVKFEDAGRAIDKEVTKLADYLNKKVKPATKEEAAKLLRRASRNLSKMARSLEKTEGGV